VPILDPREGLYLQCLLSLHWNMCVFRDNIMIIFVELKRQMRSIYVSFVEHKLIEQTFGKVYRK
jgi:hypothetical protein